MTKVGSTITNQSDYGTVSEKTLVLTLDKPTGVTVTKQTTNSISLTWDAVDGATSYEYCIDDDDTWKPVPAGSGVPANSCTIKKLAAGTAYTFQIKAVAGSIKSPESDSCTTATLPEKVELLTATVNGSDSATLSWNWSGTSTITGFNIQYREVGTTSWLPCATPDESLRSLTLPSGTLSANTKYEFQIQAIGVAASEFTGSNEILTQLVGPTVLKWDADSQKLTWNQPSDFATSGMNHYVLEWMPASYSADVWSQASSMTLDKGDTEKVMTELQPGVKYQFRLRAVILDGNNKIVNDSVADICTAEKEIDLIPLQKPEVAISNVQDHQFTVSWAAVDHAQSYGIFWGYVGTTEGEAQSGMNHNPIIVTGTSYTIDFLYDPADEDPEGTLPAGSAYVVWVYAYAAPDSGYVDSKGTQVTTPTKLEAPVLAPITGVTTSSVTLQWSVGDQTGAKYYQIQYDDGTGWKTFNKDFYPTWNGQFVHDFVAKGNTSYSFRIVAVPTTGSDRVTSNTESAKTKLGVSAELTATMKDTKTVKLDWNSVDGAKGYYVEWIYNTQNWTDAGIVTHREYVSTGTTYTYNTLASGTTYKFRVQAAGTISKAPGYAVAGPVTTQVAAPTNLQIVSVGDRSVKLTWTPGSLTGVSSYTIQYKEVGSPEEMSDLVTGYDSSKSFYEVVNKLNANKTYEFQIKAVGTVFGTDSEWAEKSMTEATKLSKPYNLSEVVAQTTWNSLTLSWSDDANPTGTTYEVQYLVNGVWTTVPNASITFNDKTATITGLEPGQAYSFQVRAVSKTGTTYNNTSEWSTALENMQTAKVQLPQATITGVADKGAPVLNATNTAKTVSVTVSWTYSTSSEAAYAKTFTVKDADGKTCGTVNWDSAKTSYSLDIAGLDPDTEYTFTVEVSGDTGKATSATSASQSFTTQTVAPWSLAVTATESNSVSLSWTEQKSQKDVTQYLVQWCIDGVWTTGYGSQLVDSGLEFVKIGGLVAKTNYTFRIAVLDVNRSTTGNEVWSCSDELKDIITLPAMVDVTKVTLTSQPWLKDNGVLSSVRIDWAAVTGATDYHVYWREAGSTEGWESSKGVYVNVAQHYAYVSGLVPSNTYEFCIAAVTGGGESTWTAPLSATMLQAVHDKPVGLEVVSGSVGVTQLTLQWDAPATGTVNALYSTTYGVKYSLNGAALQDYTGTIVVSENSGKLSCELSGLQPGGKYEFVVYAKDSTEATKSADSASTPATWMLTNKPENVKATGHSSSITLTWDAPTVQDSSGIVGYAIMFEHSDGKSYYVTSIYPTLGQTKFEFKADTFTIKVNGTDTPITLKSNTPYTFYIYSFNSVGNPSEFAKAEGKTLLATAKSAVVENGSVTNTAKIKITMSSDQGSGTAFYRVQWRKADSTEILGTQWFPISQLSGNVLDLNGDSYVFSIGTQYAFDVTAWNRDKDENTHSDTLTVTWATKAEKVKAVKLTVIDENTINIRCDLPETKTGIDKYKVDCYIVGQSNVVQTMTLTESEIYNGVNFTVLPLTDYYFVVTSIGLQGIHNSDGVKSDEVTTPFTVTGTQPTGVNAWRSATFTWPAYQGTFTGYKVEYTVDTTINGAPDWTKVKTKPTTLQSTITLTATNGGDGLIAGQPVWVRVSVMNGTTVVKVSEVSKVLNSLTVPAPIISGFANDILSLSAPQVVLGNYVQSYEIWYDTGNGWVKTFSLVTRPNLNKLLEVDLTSLGLVNGNKIQVRSIGYGVATEWSTMFTVQ